MGGNSTYNPPPYYRPPTAVATRQVPFAALVQRVDEEWAREKFREIVYEFTRRWWRQNPYITGAYNTPAKTTTVNYAGPATFNAGDLTGVGFDFVTVLSTAVNPGTLTTRTAAQMFADIAKATVGMDWALRLVNLDGTASSITLKPGAGVAFMGPIAPIRFGTYSDFVATFTSPAAMTIALATQGGLFSGVS